MTRSLAGARLSRLMIQLSLILITALSCSRIEPAAPVPVQGSEAERSALAGDWSGRYWSKETGRHGIIRFRLPEHADTGFGEVEITFSPSLSLARAGAAADDFKDYSADELSPEPSTVIDIKMVLVQGGQVRGTMAPYWDPDCNCRVRTEFEGRLSGDEIAGTFNSRRESSDRRKLAGEWRVDRQ